MPWSPLPTSDARGGAPAPTQLPALLDSVLAGLGAPTASTVVVVHEHWADLVGDELADHAHPVAIESGVLRVGVDSGAWASHLRWSEAEVLTRIEALVGPGVVTSITARIARR